MVKKAGITAFLLGSFLMLASVLPAQARDNCDKRVRKAEDNLRKETRKHGEHSPQAQYRWRELEEARSSCGYYQARIRERDRDHDRDHKRHHKGHDRDHDGDHDGR